MVYPPGQGKSGQHLMELWREYLEKFADSEGKPEDQTIIGAYQAAEVLIALSQTLDSDHRYKELIDQRLYYFHEGISQARDFKDCLLNAAFSIYNSFNTLGHQLTEGNDESAELIRQVDQQVRQGVADTESVARSSAALRASFPLLSLITIAMDEHQEMTEAIRLVEKRFAAASNAASSDWEHLLNALYRIVEMMQIFAFATDPDLKDQIDQIASRFKEEDQPKELRFKLRNGFCRLFELGHLLATQIDALV
jgi:hypothetical protein